ncbi:MAG: DUF5908 family protein [Acetobacteraceae bacterium]|jgi:hypothetical protein
MTLEISEIGVRLAIGDPPAPAAPRSGMAVPSGQPVTIPPQQMEALIQACVQEVLRTLRMLEER